MTDPNTPPPKKRFARAKKWRKRLVITVLALLFLYHVPLLEYLQRVVASVVKTGISRDTAQAIARDSDWFWRFFTGPPSDAEMKAFFEKNRPTFERLAYLYATSQCYPAPEDKTCGPLTEKIGVYTDLGDVVKNTIYPQSQISGCHPACQTQRYTFREEAQNWWRSTNPGIGTWRKGFIYVPPLLPAQTLGLDPLRFPDDRDEIVRRLCGFPRQSLDTLVPELEQEPFYSDACGFRPIGDGWYLIMTAGYNLRTPWFGRRG